MSLRLNEKLFAFAGDTLAVALDAEVRLFREREEFASFRAETRVEHLKVSPDGRALLLYGASAGRVWSWNDREGLRLLASAMQSRDAFGCGFVDIGGHLLLLVAQHGVLRGISSDGEQAFTANMRSPHSFLPRIFVPLPGGRLALLGSMFGDPQDTIVTVAIDALVQGGDCVQRAIGEGLPVSDRAVDIAVGPCAPDHTVVFRDPEEEEDSGDDQEPEELGDVFGFRGIYVRDLNTGALVERHAYAGRAGTELAADRKWIAIQVAGGIDLMRRGSGEVKEIREPAVLDPVSLKIARIQQDANNFDVVPIEAFTR
jgi:hypothetical protein